jgi:purine-binding chemotaxis protein CheW
VENPLLEKKYLPEIYMEQQLVVFELANEYYGIGVDLVESIIKMRAVTQLPRTPSCVKGVTNLRGSVLPVVDLRARFGLEEKDETRQSRIIVVAMGNIKVGVVVDGVSEVLRVSDESIESLPPLINPLDSAFLKGIVRSGDRLIILLELSKVLNLDEQKSLEALSA